MRLGFREILFLTVMLALFGCTYFMVFRKANTKRDNLRAEIVKKQKSLADLKRSTAGVEDLARKITELQDAISFFESKLPKEKEIDDILDSLSRLASVNSLTTRTVKTLKPETAANYREQPIQMWVSGDFNGFYAFLLQLEKLPRLTRITQMKLDKITDRDGEAQAQITLSIFFEPDRKANPSAAVATIAEKE
jgi:type IV pilus assembly protein PilO